MSSGWTCFKCNAPNSLADKHCNVCGAVRPKVADTLNDGEVCDAVTASQASPEKVEAQSDMLSGLAFLVRSAANGTMTPAEFSRKMAQASKSLDEVFGQMASELNSVSEQSEYTDTVNTALSDSRYLFKLALNQLERFGDKKDMSRLRIGMLLAEKAEDCYQELVKGLQKDAQGHDLQGKRDIVRALAYQVIEGSLSYQEYKDSINTVKEAVNAWLIEGSEDLNAALNAAETFDGKQYDTLERVGQLLEKASEKLANVILAVHSQETINENIGMAP